MNDDPGPNNSIKKRPKFVAHWILVSVLSIRVTKGFSGVPPRVPKSAQVCLTGPRVPKSALECPRVPKSPQVCLTGSKGAKGWPRVPMSAQVC